jgi:hypothetical protein
MRQVTDIEGKNYQVFSIKLDDDGFVISFSIRIDDEVVTYCFASEVKFEPLSESEAIATAFTAQGVILGIIAIAGVQYTVPIYIGSGIAGWFVALMRPRKPLVGYLPEEMKEGRAVFLGKWKKEELQKVKRSPPLPRLANLDEIRKPK